MASSTLPTPSIHTSGLPGLPRGPLFPAQQLEALRRVQLQAERRVKLGSQLFKAAEARAAEHRQSVDVLRRDLEARSQEISDRIGGIDDRLAQQIAALQRDLEAHSRRWEESQALAESLLRRDQDIAQRVGEINDRLGQQIGAIQEGLVVHARRLDEAQPQADSLLRRTQEIDQKVNQVRDHLDAQVEALRHGLESTDHQLEQTHAHAESLLRSDQEIARRIEEIRERLDQQVAALQQGLEAYVKQSQEAQQQAESLRQREHDSRGQEIAQTVADVDNRLHQQISAVQQSLETFAKQSQEARQQAEVLHQQDQETRGDAIAQRIAELQQGLENHAQQAQEAQQQADHLHQRDQESLGQPAAQRIAEVDERLRQQIAALQQGLETHAKQAQEARQQAELLHQQDQESRGQEIAQKLTEIDERLRQQIAALRQGFEDQAHSLKESWPQVESLIHRHREIDSKVDQTNDQLSQQIAILQQGLEAHGRQLEDSQPLAESLLRRDDEIDQKVAQTNDRLRQQIDALRQDFAAHIRQWEQAQRQEIGERLRQQIETLQQGLAAHTRQWEQSQQHVASLLERDHESRSQEIAQKVGETDDRLRQQIGALHKSLEASSRQWEQAQQQAEALRRREQESQDLGVAQKIGDIDARLGTFGASLDARLEAHARQWEESRQQAETLRERDQASLTEQIAQGMTETDGRLRQQIELLRQDLDTRLNQAQEVQQQAAVLSQRDRESHLQDIDRRIGDVDARLGTQMTAIKAALETHAQAWQDAEQHAESLRRQDQESRVQTTTQVIAEVDERLRRQIAGLEQALVAQANQGRELQQQATALGQQMVAMHQGLDTQAKQWQESQQQGESLRRQEEESRAHAIALKVGEVDDRLARQIAGLQQLMDAFARQSQESQQQAGILGQQVTLLQNGLETQAKQWHESQQQMESVRQQDQEAQARTIALKITEGDDRLRRQIAVLQHSLTTQAKQWQESQQQAESERQQNEGAHAQAIAQKITDGDAYLQQQIELLRQAIESHAQQREEARRQTDGLVQRDESMDRKIKEASDQATERIARLEQRLDAQLTQAQEAQDRTESLLRSAVTLLDQNRSIARPSTGQSAPQATGPASPPCDTMAPGMPGNADGAINGSINSAPVEPQIERAPAEAAEDTEPPISYAELLQKLRPRLKLDIDGESNGSGTEGYQAVQAHPHASKLAHRTPLATNELPAVGQHGKQATRHPMAAHSYICGRDL